MEKETWYAICGVIVFLIIIAILVRVMVPNRQATSATSSSGGRAVGDEITQGLRDANSGLVTGDSMMAGANF